MGTAIESESNIKGDIGETAFEHALQRLGFVTSKQMVAIAESNANVQTRGTYRRGDRDSYRDDKGRAIADFVIFHTTCTKDTHIDVKCHDTWHWYAELQTWQAGVGMGLLRSYQDRALEESNQTPTTAHVVIIKRGRIPLGRRDGLPLPHHPSPHGVWIAAVDDLIERGFERYIPGEKGIGMCSTRAIDGGVWRPFAPWNDSKMQIIVDRNEDPVAWDAFFAREMPQAMVP